MPDNVERQYESVTLDTEVAEHVKSVSVSAEDIVMCHRYPARECLDPVDCPIVYAGCWLARIRER